MLRGPSPAYHFGFSRDPPEAPSRRSAWASPWSRHPLGFAARLPAATVPLREFPAARAPQPRCRPLGEAGSAGRGPGRPGSGSGRRENPGGSAEAAPAGPGAEGPPPGPSLDRWPGSQTPALLEAQGPPQAETEDLAGPGGRLQGRRLLRPGQREAPPGASAAPGRAPGRGFGAQLWPFPAASLLGMWQPRCADRVSPLRMPRGPPEPLAPFTACCPTPPGGRQCRSRASGCSSGTAQDPKVAQGSELPVGGAPESP